MAVPLADLPPGFIPELPDTTIATTLQISSPAPPAFQKEVDLAFPKPAEAPDDATYSVYRRLVGPDGLSSSLSDTRSMDWDPGVWRYRYSRSCRLLVWV